MTKPIALANSLTIVALIVYAFCRVLSLIAPDFLFSISNSWFHTFSLGGTKSTDPFSITAFIFGAVTLGLLVWGTAYLGAILYNKFAR